MWNGTRTHIGILCNMYKRPPSKRVGRCPYHLSITQTRQIWDRIRLEYDLRCRNSIIPPQINLLKDCSNKYISIWGENVIVKFLRQNLNSISYDIAVRPFKYFWLTTIRLSTLTQHIGIQFHEPLRWFQRLTRAYRNQKKV